MEMKQLSPFAGWTALILGFGALIIFLFLPEYSLVTLTIASVAGINAVFFFVMSRKEVLHALKTRTAPVWHEYHSGNPGGFSHLDLYQPSDASP